MKKKEVLLPKKCILLKHKNQIGICNKGSEETRPVETSEIKKAIKQKNN